MSQRIEIRPAGLQTQIELLPQDGPGSGAENLLAEPSQPYAGPQAASTRLELSGPAVANLSAPFGQPAAAAAVTSHKPPKFKQGRVIDVCDIGGKQLSAGAAGANLNAPGSSQQRPPEPALVAAPADDAPGRVRFRSLLSSTNAPLAQPRGQGDAAGAPAPHWQLGGAPVSNGGGGGGAAGIKASAPATGQRQDDIRLDRIARQGSQARPAASGRPQRPARWSHSADEWSDEELASLEAADEQMFEPEEVLYERGKAHKCVLRQNPAGPSLKRAQPAPVSSLLVGGVKVRGPAATGLARRLLEGLKSLKAIGGGGGGAGGDYANSHYYRDHPYVAYEDRDLLTGLSKEEEADEEADDYQQAHPNNPSGQYPAQSPNQGPTVGQYPVGQLAETQLGAASSSASLNAAASRRFRLRQAGRSFRGGYSYSRAHVSMAILGRVLAFLFQRSTAALLGAFLIHVTLGTVYTLSNINSYLTSYVRLHGAPQATYGSSMWISSAVAIGQGMSMVLGGYIEKRFSARLACALGCLLHSGSTIATSWAIDHGYLAVLFTYGFLPGFGCGLAYMTPMINGFGWFPRRRGLVAGVILTGFGIGTFVFNMAQTAFVNPANLSPLPADQGYFTQPQVLDQVPRLFVFIGSVYAAMQFVGCCLLFQPPNRRPAAKAVARRTSGAATDQEEAEQHRDDHQNDDDEDDDHHHHHHHDDRANLIEDEMSFRKAMQTREFAVLFLVYGTITQGVLFVNAMLKEYGQLFISDDMYLSWVGSMASVANALGRLSWGLAIDSYSFGQCFTCITVVFGAAMFMMPFEFVLSSKLLYLLCTLTIFGSFSGWMSTFPVHVSRVFGRTNSGMIYGVIYLSQSIGSVGMALGAHYLIDHFNRFVPFFCVAFLELLALSLYHLFYPK